MTAQETKLVARIAKWRQAANEATTADAAVTYLECASELEADIAVKILLAVCEGCGVTVPMPTKTKGARVYPDVPDGWSQSCVSKHRLEGHGPRLAAWCQRCRLTLRSPRSPEQE